MDIILPVVIWKTFVTVKFFNPIQFSLYILTRYHYSSTMMMLKCAILLEYTLLQWFYPILQKLVVRRHPYTHAHCLNFEIALRFGKNFREVSFEELASDYSSIVLTY